MRTTLFKAALTFGLLGVVQAAEAQQGGIRLSGDLSQSFELRDNNNLSGSGLDFTSLTGATFRLTSQTPTTNVSASTGVSLTLGEGGFSLTRPKLNLGFGTQTKRVSYTGNLSYSKGPVAVEETQPDLSILQASADRSVISGRFGATTRINPTTGVSFGLGMTRTAFDPTTATLVPSNDFGLTGRITYQMNQRTSYSFNGGLGYFEAQDTANTKSISADIGTQLTHQMTRDTSFDGNLGLSFIDTTDTLSSVQTSAFSVSLLFGAGLTRTLDDGSISVSLNQDVNPSATGSLALGTRLNGAYTKTLNQNESYGIDASLGRQENIGGGAVTTFINVSPSYSRQITRDVSATASYFVQRDDGGAMAQGLTLSFSRPYDFPVQ